MEQHPIPQDVTGFQFKLIGTMTVKQFGYVAVGGILATLSYYAPVQGIFWHLVAKGLCLPFFAILGIVLAFVPIEGRPVDVMAANFFHALITPNQYVYMKKGRKFSFNQITYAKPQPVTAVVVQKPAAPVVVENKKERQLRALLASSYKDSRSTLDTRENEFLQTISSLPQPALQPISQPIRQEKSDFKEPVIESMAYEHKIINPVPHISDIQQPVPAQPEPLIPQPVVAAVIQPDQAVVAEMNASHQKVLDLQKQTQDIHAQKEQVEQELLRLKNQISAPKTTITPVDQAPQAAPQDTQAHVRNIPQNMSVSAGFSHISDTPNVIVGVIKDSRGNILPNILVEVKDKDGNPVRAFKTNPLGQFASATPLSEGIYTIELEDPKKKHAFDVIQISAKGQIMLPLEIISHDAREELRKALFTN